MFALLPMPISASDVAAAPPLAPARAAGARWAAAWASGPGRATAGGDGQPYGAPAMGGGGRPGVALAGCADAGEQPGGHGLPLGGATTALPPPAAGPAPLATTDGLLEQFRGPHLPAAVDGNRDARAFVRVPNNRKGALLKLGCRPPANDAAGAGNTYCHIYAPDDAHGAGAYLPRVWWTRKALVALAAGQAVPPAYGTTVQELNAHSRYHWFEEFGPDFGWRRSVDLTEVQNAANTGQVCIISGQRKDLNTAGHLCAVVPETAQHRAGRQGERVTRPLLSQAGARNFEYGGRVWWTGAQFGRFGFWIHA